MGPGDQGPLPPKHEAPKPSPEFKQWRRGEVIRVVIKLLLVAGILIFGILWHNGWRPF